MILKNVKSKQKSIKGKGIKVAVIAVVILVTLSSAVFAVNQMKDDTRKVMEGSKKDINNEISVFNKPIASFDEYKKQFEKAIEEKTKKKLSPERVVELYNQGYAYPDIEYAECLSITSEISPEEILRAKGKYQVDVIHPDGQASMVKTSGKSWDSVANELNIDIRKPTEKLGMTDEDLKEFKSQGLSEDEIIEAGVLAVNNDKLHKEILKELKNGKSVEVIKKQYWEEKKSTPKEVEMTDEVKRILEEGLKARYKITNEDIDEAKQNGINTISEIGLAKEIAEKANTSFDNVLKVKKDKNDWNKVKDSLGVKFDEN